MENTTEFPTRLTGVRINRPRLICRKQILLKTSTRELLAIRTPRAAKPTVYITFGPNGQKQHFLSPMQYMMLFFFPLHLMLSLSLKQICLTEHISISNVFCIKTSLCLNFFRFKIGYSGLHIRIKGRIVLKLFAMNSRFDLGQLYFLC